MEAIFNTNLQETDYSTPAYRVVMSYVITKDADGNDINPQTMYAEIDYQDGAVDVTSTAKVSDYPTMNGFNVSDHIYREPIKLSINGKFAENGSKAMHWTGSDRLTAIQKEFETLHRLGTKFKISVMKGFDTEDDSTRRYISRNNMVLEDIHWKENQDTLDFSFSFKEAISTTAALANPLVNVRDPNLPAITDLVTASLVGDVLPEEEVAKIITEVMYKKGCLTEYSAKMICHTIGSTLILAPAAIGIAATTLVAIATGMKVLIAVITAAITGAAVGSAAATATVAAMVPVGTIVAIAAVIVAVIAIGIYHAYTAKKVKKYKELGIYFDIDKNATDQEKQDVAEKYCNFMANCMQHINSKLSNVSVYSFVNDDRQECMLSMNGNYYTLKIEKNNVDNHFYMTAVDINDDVIMNSKKMVGVTSFSEMTAANAFLEDKENKQYRVYLLDKYGATDLNDKRSNTLDDFLLIVANRSLDGIEEDITKAIKDYIKL